jgi:hypothetical protein
MDCHSRAVAASTRGIVVVVAAGALRFRLRHRLSRYRSQKAGAHPMTIPTLIPARRTAAALVVATATAAALLTGCGGPSTAPQASSTSTAPKASSPAGNVAEVTTVAGQRIRIPEGKPAAMFFFSVDCGNCVAGGKAFAEASRSAAGSADFIAVDLNPSESAEKINGFLAQVDGAQLPAVIDTGAALTGRVQVGGPTTVVVVDASGAVTDRTHEPTAQAITAAVKKAGG